MSDETEGARGAAAWQEQRDALAKRNQETKKKGQAERRTRERAVVARERVEAAREVEQLDELNARIAKRRTPR